jgi:hypothetical protein
MENCTKVGFDSQKKAEARLLELAKINELQPSAKDIPKKAYKCDHCHQWHLTAGLKGKAKQQHQKRKELADWRKEVRQEVYEQYGTKGLSNFEKMGKRKTYGNK